MAIRTMFFSSCVLGGGAGWSLYYLIKHLNRDRFDPLVVLPASGIFGQRYADLDVPVIAPTRLPHRTAQMRFAHHNQLTEAASYGLNVWDSLRFIPTLVSLIREHRIELLYCNNMMVKTIGAVAAERAGIPCVLHVRNVHETPGKVWLYPRTLGRLKAVKRIIAVSDAAAAPYRRYVPEKVTVIRNGVDLEGYDAQHVPHGTFREAYGLRASATVVGYTGQLIPRKGLDVLLHAAARLLPSRPDLQFVAVGQTPAGSAIDYLAEYRALARSLRVDARFQFVPFRDDIRPAVVDFDILALPARQDPFPRSIIEALALGVPVVASRVGGIPEIVEDGKQGLLVPPDDPQALADALAALIDDPARRVAMGRAAADHARQHCDVAQLTPRIERVFEEALTAA